MTQRIDHLVWYNADLDEGRRHFAAQMDCPPAYGGEHPGEGTANAVMALGTATYLEILGRDPAQDAASLAPEVRGLSGSGLYHWAVGGMDLNVLAERATKAGLKGSALVSGGRMKPDGTWLGWTCFGLHGHGFGALVPFFIDWGESEHPALSAPRGGALVDFEVRTSDFSRLSSIYNTLELDIRVTHDAVSGIRATLESMRGRVELQGSAPMPQGFVI